MADNPFAFWTEEWRKAQDNYWSAWQALSGLGRADSGFPSQVASPWTEALERWWQSASPAAPAPVQEFYAHLIDQGKVFYNLTESWRAVAGNTDGAHVMEEWQRLLRKSLEGFKATALTGQGPGDKTLREMLTFWELPMDTWERTASVMSGLPGDFLESFKIGAAGDKGELVREQFHRFLSVPGLGYTREHQEQYQVLTRLMIDYQYAKQEFSAEFVRIAADTVERFQEKTKGLSAADQSITTLQGFYDLWVDAAEEAYAERVFSEDYARAHGRLINSLMAVKRQGRAVVDEVLGMLNMPTEQEMNTVHERFQELRRELRVLRSEVAAGGAPSGAPPPALRPAKRKPAKRAGGPAAKKATAATNNPTASKKAGRKKAAGSKTGATGRRQERS